MNNSNGIPSVSQTPSNPLVEPARPLPLDAFPLVVARYIGQASAAIGCDPSFIALPVLACLARAIGNTRTIELKPTWKEPAIIWAALVGKSGTHKTPALQTAMAALNAIQNDAFQVYDKELEDFNENMLCYERDLAEWKKPRKNAVPAPPPSKPTEPSPMRYIVSDITIEALADRLYRQEDGVLVVRDELAGWVGGIAEYKGGKGSDLGHWLAMWSAAPLTVDRKTGAIKTVHVPRASVSIVGGIQPGILRQAIGREHLQDGLCARLLLAMPEPKPVQWSDKIIDPAAEKAFADLIDQLITLQPDSDADKGFEPISIPLTPEAHRVWVEYFNRHRAKLADLDEDLAAAGSKLEAYTARFALIFQLAAWASGEGASNTQIDQLAIESAIRLSDWLGCEA